MREGIPALLYPDGQSGPYVARFLACRDQCFTVARAAALLGVAPSRIAQAFGAAGLNEQIPRPAIVAYCRCNPGNVARWQQTYRAKARPPVNAVPPAVTDAR